MRARLCSAFLLSTFAALLTASEGVATSNPTITITPDKATYSVGEQITLSIVGDPMDGRIWDLVSGRLLFGADLARYVSSSQTALSTTYGTITLDWFASPLYGGVLPAGDGFAWAFSQLLSGDDWVWIDAPLHATVVLEAISAGSLAYDWDSYGFTFHGTCAVYCGEFAPIAPGGSVTIVPEPNTLSLVALGMLALIFRRRSAAGASTPASG